MNDLRETMLEIASGNQNLRAKETGAHELREVTRQFNAMLDQIDQLMIDIRRQEETTRQYQLQALSEPGLIRISSITPWIPSSGWLNFRIVSAWFR